MKLNSSRIWYKIQFACCCLGFWCAMRVICYRSEIQHISLISATYYKNSSLYPPNTVVILFNSQKSWKPEKHLICKSWPIDPDTTTSSTTALTDLAHVRHAFMPTLVCKWATYIAVCKVSPSPKVFALSDTRLKSTTPIRIPLRNAYEKKLNVISCFSPLFYNERWQLIIPTLEIYRQFGVDLQVFYLQSIREEIFNLLQAYKNASHVEIEPWLLMNLGEDFRNPQQQQLNDPNKELEWRNQAAAHTDCFLKYRESADFIIVSDIDDILLPRIGNTYAQEFEYLALHHPFAVGFTYNRYKVDILSSRTPGKFSLLNLFSSAKMMDEWEDGKSVIRPSRVQTAWIHWPSIYESGYHLFTVPDDQNFMMHFRNWTMSDSSSSSENSRIPSFFNSKPQKPIISLEKAKTLETNAKEFIAKYAAQEFQSLPLDIHYYPIIEECYNRIFYSKSKRIDSCPGPLSCDLPNFIANVSCVIAKRSFSHRLISKNLEIHFPSNADRFVANPNGCQMSSI